MDIDNALPGHLVASVFEVLLIDAGYQVIPTGIEKTIRELRTVPVGEYIDLVPPRLRSSPDFFVLDLEAGQSWLTEIKLRHYLHPKLCDDLRNMHRDWAPFTLILAVADSSKEWTGIVRHIKVFTIEAETRNRRRVLQMQRRPTAGRLWAPWKAVGRRNDPEGARRHPANCVTGLAVSRRTH